MIIFSGSDRSGFPHHTMWMDGDWMWLLTWATAMSITISSGKISERL